MRCCASANVRLQTRVRASEPYEDKAAKMNEQHLIDMANRIGEFFDSMPHRDEALTGIADHIRRFWEPRMRRAILATLDDPQASATMSPIVREALTRSRSELTPAPAG